MTVEVSDTKEGLNVLDFAWFRPILDNLNFVGGHSQAVGREHIPEVFTGSDVKFTFIFMGEKAVSAESAEYFLDVSFVLRKVIGIDQYVVQIDNDINVYHIREDVIHEPLKSCRSISKAFRHYQPLKGSVTSLEGGLPFISCCNANQMVHVPEVDFGVHSCFSWCVEQIGNERKRITILL